MVVSLGLVVEETKTLGWVRAGELNVLVGGARGLSIKR